MSQFAIQSLDSIKLISKNGPAVIENVPEYLYHAYPAMSNSGMKEFKKAPGYWDYMRKNPSKDTAARRWGRLVHMALGEPARFEHSVVVIEGSRNSNDVKNAIMKAEITGKVVVKQEELKELNEISRFCRSHPLLKEILKEGKSEVMYVWNDEETGVPCKARLDWVTSSGVICDWKTFDPIHSEDLIEKNIRDNFYHFQAAWYQEAYFQVHKKRAKNFYNVFIRSEPVDVKVTTIAKQSLEETIPYIRENLKRFAVCLAEDHWPMMEPSVSEIVVKPFWS